MVSVLNPFANYLHDSYALLNLALNQHPFSQDNVAFLARSSAMHAIGAINAAAHTCLRSINYDGHDRPKTLVEKFTIYLHEKKEGDLGQVEVALLEELDMIGRLLSSPHPAESYDFWRPSDDRVTDFERTPLKKIPSNITHWQSEFSGAVLGMAISVIKRILFDRCKFCSADMERLFGVQLTTPDKNTVGFDEELIDSLQTEQAVLLANKEFMNRMSSMRWKIQPNDFKIELKTIARRAACTDCQKLKKVG